MTITQTINVRPALIFRIVIYGPWPPEIDYQKNVTITSLAATKDYLIENGINFQPRTAHLATAQ